MESVRFQFPVAKSITNTEYIKHDSLTILNFITPFTYCFLKIDIIFKNNSYCQTHGIHTCHSVNLKVAERLKKILLKVGSSFELVEHC